MAKRNNPSIADQNSQGSDKTFNDIPPVVAGNMDLGYITNEPDATIPVDNLNKANAIMVMAASGVFTPSEIIRLVVHSEDTIDRYITEKVIGDPELVGEGEDVPTITVRNFVFSDNSVIAFNALDDSPMGTTVRGVLPTHPCYIQNIESNNIVFLYRANHGVVVESLSNSELIGSEVSLGSHEAVFWKKVDLTLVGKI